MQDTTPAPAPFDRHTQPHMLVRRTIALVLAGGRGSRLKQLTDRERHIIVERRLVDEPKTLEDLSSKYGISRERVRQIEVRAFDKLQKAMKNMVVEAAAKPTTQPAPAHA